jgi:beta-lactamase superfamily II metal-dependent hydrolase
VGLGVLAEESLILDFWDVGQGDCSVARLPDGSLVIIDVGPKGSPVIDWLSEKPQKIRAVLITHNDRDHAGALPSLVKLPGQQIETIYMLIDRNKNSKAFQDIFRPVREEELKGKYQVLGLSSDRIIWESDNKDIQIKVVYPSFTEGVEANRPNESSAIVCLCQNGKERVIWPGDAPFEIIADKCSGSQPFVLHGPHHGAPVDRHKKDFQKWVGSVEPERVFVSVGTRNGDDHPFDKYLATQSKRGCRVVCSQLTRHCDNERIHKGTPILQTAALLGLKPPRSGISCRGCWRVTLKKGQFLGDPFDGTHLERIKKLRRPQCLKTV